MTTSRPLSRNASRLEYPATISRTRAGSASVGRSSSGAPTGIVGMTVEARAGRAWDSSEPLIDSPPGLDLDLSPRSGPRPERHEQDQHPRNRADDEEGPRPVGPPADHPRRLEPEAEHAVPERHQGPLQDRDAQDVPHEHLERER